jgi:SAM-dependent methyltransferase
VSFAVPAELYDRFMGRYSVPLASRFAELAVVTRGDTVLDVGCGTGALTAELVDRLTPAAVSAVDPSEQLVAAARARHPEVTVRQAAAEQLPFPDDSFHSALAQLVVNFMADPVVGLAEMARVTRRDGVVAACVWDHGGGRGPLSVFWAAARELDPDVRDESDLAGAREGQLAELFEAAGLRSVEETAISVVVEHPSFEDWWEPYTFGVGTVGTYMNGLEPGEQARLRELCRERLPDPPFRLTAWAWAARGLH